MIRCSSCGAENQSGALFCEMCGTRLTGAAAPPAPQPLASTPGASVTCPTCGTPAIPGEAFCDNCGASLLAAPAQPAAQQPSPVPPAQPAPQPVYPPPQPIAAGPAVSCPNCGTPAIPGEAFCDNCGAALGTLGAAAAPSAAVPAPVSAAAGPAAASASPAPPPAASTPQAPATAVTTLQGAALDFAGTQIPLPAKQEAILGRQDPVSGHFPDVDLMPYGAFESGVGRRHARILVRGGQILIEDLDSTNGTLVNRQRLRPRQPLPLNGGEEIRLGKLVFTFKKGAG